MKKDFVNLNRQSMNAKCIEAANVTIAIANNFTTEMHWKNIYYRIILEIILL